MMGDLGVWNKTLPPHCSWVAIFEDDAVVEPNFMQVLTSVLSCTTAEVYYLDGRVAYGYFVPPCCQIGMLYHRSILPRLVRDLGPSGYFHADYAARHPPGVSPLSRCENDWVLSDYLARTHTQVFSVALLPHAPLFRSRTHSGAPR
jgi:hypothetical protein